MELVIIGAIALLAWLGIEIARFQDEVAKTTLERWSDEERVTLVRAERRWLDTGPFPVLLAGDLPVFEVTVRSIGGRERAGLLRCGRFPLGVLDPHVEVHWRGEQAPAQVVAAQPVAPQAVAAQPVAAQPVAAQPVAAQPIAAQGVPVQPVAQVNPTQVDATQVDAIQAGSAAPGAARTDAAQPGPR